MTEALIKINTRIKLESAEEINELDYETKFVKEENDKFADEQLHDKGSCIIQVSSANKFRAIKCEDGIEDTSKEPLLLCKNEEIDIKDESETGLEEENKSLVEIDLEGNQVDPYKIKLEIKDVTSRQSILGLRHRQILSLILNDELEILAYKCGVCSLETKYGSHLKQHMLVPKGRSELQIHKCDLCSFATRRGRSLRKHLATHKKARMHQCGVCSFKAKYESKLKQHLLVHKDRPPVQIHKCDVCSFTSRHRGSLQKHLAAHKNVQTHECGVCSFKTKYGNNLKKHMLVHMGRSEVQIYKCDICSFTTRHRGSLWKHLAAHKNVLYKCGVCSFETKRMGSLKRHVLLHKEKSNTQKYRL